MSSLACIVTKDRPKKLARAVASLCVQSIPFDEIVVVDNSVEQSALPVVMTLQNLQKITYLHKPNLSVPECRQLAYLEEDCDLVAYIDDDCLVSRGWHQAAQAALGKNPQAAFVSGPICLGNPDSPVAMAQWVRDTYWLQQNLDSVDQVSYKFFDTKNVCINKQVTKDVASFSPHRQEKAYDSGDLDFAAQLKQANQFGVYSYDSKCWHFETEDIRRFLNRAYYRGQVGRKIEEALQTNLELLNPAITNKMILLFKSLIYTFKDFMRYYTLHSKFPNILGIVVLIKLYDFFYGSGYLSFNQSTQPSNKLD